MQSRAWLGTADRCVQETRTLLRDSHGSDNVLHVAAIRGVQHSLALNVRARATK
jgi:hypothetical protein